MIKNAPSNVTLGGINQKAEKNWKFTTKHEKKFGSILNGQFNVDVCQGQRLGHIPSL